MYNFSINDEDILLKSAFSGNNYEIVNGMAKNKLCIIFCSGNGIYHPDTNGSFRDSVIGNDMYECRQTACNVLDYVERVVFIRDLHKCWYASGINDNVDSVDKLIDFLRPLCNGYRLVLMGNSAGGYIASLLGYKLKADFVLNWCGQCNLWEHNNATETVFFVSKYIKDISRSRYYNLATIMKDNTCPIYYFYPTGCGHDVVQSKLWAEIPNVMPIALDSSRHGQCVGKKQRFALLLSDNKQLTELYKKCIGKVLSVSELEEFIDCFPIPAKYYELELGAITSADKTRIYRDALLKWMEIKQRGANLFFDHKYDGLTKFAVYGRGGVFKLLKTELEQAHKFVECIVETLPSSSQCNGIPVLKPSELNSDIDAVVIIPYYDKSEIRMSITESGYKGQILSLDELMEDI